MQIGCTAQILVGADVQVKMDGMIFDNSSVTVLTLKPGLNPAKIGQYGG